LNSYEKQGGSGFVPGEKASPSKRCPPGSLQGKKKLWLKGKEWENPQYPCQKQTKKNERVSIEPGNRNPLKGIHLEMLKEAGR